MADWVYWNGDILQSSQVVISPLEAAVLYGANLFETLRTYQGKPFLLNEHLARITSSAEFFRTAMPLSSSEIEAVISELLIKNSLPEAVIRITLFLNDQAPVKLLITAKQLPRFKECWRTCSAPWLRDKNNPLLRHKTGNYLHNTLAFQYISAGTDECFFFNQDGYLCEGAKSNVFIIDGNRQIITPSLDNGLLPGVIRHYLLQTAPRLDLSLKEADISREQLYRAQGVFCTNSVWGIIPVQSFDGASYQINDHIMTLLNSIFPL